MNTAATNALEKLMKEAGLQKYSLPELVGKKFVFLPDSFGHEVELSLGGTITGFVAYKNQIILSVSPIFIKTDSHISLAIDYLSFIQDGWVAQNHTRDDGRGKGMTVGKLKIV
jgi:hypothetical protein